MADPVEFFQPCTRVGLHDCAGRWTNHDRRPECPHCPDGHGAPNRCSWGVYVASERDSDGQPVYLRVQPTDGAHVAQADADWLYALMRSWRPA